MLGRLRITKAESSG